VQVRFHTSDGVRPLDVGPYRVEPGAGLLSELRVLFGTDAVRVEPRRDGVVVVPQARDVPAHTA
jgi:hypothetical protein